MGIKMLHFADAHVGMENYGSIDPDTGVSTRVKDFLDRMDEVIDYGIQHDVDLAIFAGDAYKTRNPSPTYKREFESRIKRLSEHCPVVMVVGNHDMPGMASKAHTMDAFATLNVPNVIIGDRPGGQVVETKSGPVYVAWMPYPMRNRLLALEENQGKTIEELEAALREQVGAILRSLRPERNDIPAVLAGHFTVNGATTGAEGLLALGKDVAALLEDVADPAWDYVAMGHIHKFQDVNAGRYPSVVYPGSLERVDFGEANDPKGFCWVDLERGKTSWEFIEVNARPFIVVDIDITESEAPADTAIEAIAQANIPAGAVVKVRVKMRADQQGMLREKELQDALAGTSSVTIAKDVTSEVRTRLGDLSPEAMTPLELVGTFFESKGEPQERIDVLLPAAGEMMG